MKKILSKKNSSKNGSTVKEDLTNLIANISIAKGTLATLSVHDPSGWTKKLTKMDPEHLRILLRDVMEEIWSAEETLTKLTTDPRPRLLF